MAAMQQDRQRRYAHSLFAFLEQSQQRSAALISIVCLFMLEKRDEKERGGKMHLKKESGQSDEKIELFQYKGVGRKKRLPLSRSPARRPVRGTREETAAPEEEICGPRESLCRGDTHRAIADTRRESGERVGGDWHKMGKKGGDASSSAFPTNSHACRRVDTPKCASHEPHKECLFHGSGTLDSFNNYFWVRRALLMDSCCFL